MRFCSFLSLSIVVGGTVEVPPLMYDTYEAMREAATEAEKNLRFPPYLGAPEDPPRWDWCPLGTLALVRRIATTGSSRVYEAELIEGFPQTVFQQTFFDLVNPDADEKPKAFEYFGSPVVSEEGPLAPPSPHAGRLALHSEEKDSVVVKYVSDCSARLSGLPLNSAMFEYSVQSALNDSGISPKVFYISPPSIIDKNTDRERGLVNRQLDACIAAGAQVRFIVMEKVGIDLITFLAPRFQFATQFHMQALEYVRDTLVLTIKGIEQIKKLHAHGLIHGDIHPGNFAIKSIDFDDSVDQAEILLIDFGMAEFFPLQLGKSIHRPLPTHFNPFHQTASRLSGSRPGRCDDVIRAVEQMAYLFGPGIEDVFNSAYADDPAWATQGKSRSPWFGFSDWFGFESLNILDFNQGLKHKVQGQLDATRFHLMQVCSSPDSEPPYDDVIQTLYSLSTHLPRNQ
jgi:serine/threonine protein kinase